MHCNARAIIVALLAAVALTAIRAPAADRSAPDPRVDGPPSFVVVIADDATFRDLPLYGGKDARTPNLDRLAAEGLTFDKAYVSMSMCAPCRTELYTGLYPLRNGVCWNHGRAKDGTESFAQHLGRLGYRTALAGKTHVRPPSVFAYEYLDGLEQNCVAETAAFDLGAAREFVTRDPDQPFMLVLALVVPHVVWTVGDAARFDPKSLHLPPYLADTPQTRSDQARYLAEIEVMDRQLGAVMAMLDETGVADDTVLLFTSEQGGQWPGCKWTNYDVGVHTGLVVRGPGVAGPGRRTEALVQYADVLPTLVELAGGGVAEGAFDGTSFAAVLRGSTDAHRKFAYAMHNNVPEGPPYPIRSLTDGRFHYIRNLTPDRTYVERHIMGVVEHNPYWVTWMYRSAVDDRAARLIDRYMRRPPVELYDLDADPFEMHDLADDPDHAATRARLAAELDRWMTASDDPGPGLDTRAAQRAASRR